MQVSTVCDSQKKSDSINMVDKAFSLISFRAKVILVDIHVDTCYSV